jgi:sugar-phosphatase
VEGVWRAVADEFGAEVDALLRVCHGRRSEDLVREFFAAPTHAAVVARIDEMEGARADEVTAIDGAAELIAAWGPRPWAAVTSGPRALMAARLAVAGLPVPAVLIGADDVERGKPDPEGYLAAARALGVDPAHCLVVEDAPAGIAAAKAAGARVVAVTTTHAATDLAGADEVVTSLRALLPL